MTNIKQKYKNLYADTFISDYEISSEIDFVIDVITGYRPVDILLGKEICQADDDRITAVLKERVSSMKPLQYILNTAYFCGNKYYVNENTLIPRPETEFLVEKVSSFFEENESIKILDIGTGSGCIAIELAQNYKNSAIVAVDVCQETLDIAKTNAKNRGFSEKIKFKLSNIFENISEKFNIIVSNPPYISSSEKVQYDVDMYEPHRALYAEDNGLYFYKKIIKDTKKHLINNGFIAFEVGLNQANLVKDLLLKENFVNIKFTKDCDSINRVVSAQMN